MTEFDRLRAKILANPAARKEYDRLSREGFAMSLPAHDDDGSDDGRCDKCGTRMDYVRTIGWFCPSSECSILHDLKTDPKRPDFLVPDEDWEEPDEEMTFDDRLIRAEANAEEALLAIAQMAIAIGNLVGEINRLDEERLPWWRRMFS